MIVCQTILGRNQGAMIIINKFKFGYFKGRRKERDQIGLLGNRGLTDDVWNAQKSNSRCLAQISINRTTSNLK